MANPWLARRVIAYAHQGGAKQGPSSTLYAIETALDSGATGIELDVHQSRDGKLVVSHDSTVDRTTNATGPIAERTWDELAELDAAYWFVPGADAPHDRAASDYVLRGRGPNDPAFAMTTLEAVLDAFPDVLLNLDIKQTAPLVAPYEMNLAEVLRRYRRSDDVIVASFNDRSTAAFSTAMPEVGTSPGISATTAFVQAVRANKTPDRPGGRHVALQLPDSVGGVPLIDARLVGIAHELDLAVHVWTVDEESEIERLVEVGVDAVMSDVPSVLVATLDRLGVSYANAQPRPAFGFDP